VLVGVFLGSLLLGVLWEDWSRFIDAIVSHKFIVKFHTIEMKIATSMLTWQSTRPIIVVAWLPYDRVGATAYHFA
jgi:hypothetical protein